MKDLFIVLCIGMLVVAVFIIGIFLLSRWFSTPEASCELACLERGHTGYRYVAGQCYCIADEDQRVVGVEVGDGPTGAD